MVDEAKQLGIFYIGIRTRYDWWFDIVGTDWHYPATKGAYLWYINDNGEANFYDFDGYGGWDSPDMKQYTMNQSICGSKSINQDFY